ncbi:MAG: hypothetical protein JXA67_16375 [Micromonosporaceae bacterium]|nr:hypothetical protein [Micromonosporaceae bacterium]
MSDAGAPVRGGIYPYAGIRRSDFLVISIDSLNSAGTVVVVEVAEDAPEDVRALLAVQLGPTDPLPGRWVLCWRINYAASSRFDLSGAHGRVTDVTLAAVVAGVRATIEPLG